MDADELKKWKEAGRIAGTARDYGASMIKVGASLLEVTQAVEKKILAMGAEMAFPPQVSLNRCAAHYCAEPNDDTIFQEGDLVKIDCGAHVDGCIGDTARTVDLSGGEHAHIVQASKDALAAALKVVRPGCQLSEIGAAIQDAIEAHDLSPVRNLSGHGLGKGLIHTAPSVPNYDNGDDYTLSEGQTIAIEPFASSGAGMIQESGEGNIFSFVAKRPVRMPETKKILAYIEKHYAHLPFTTRWLNTQFKPFSVKMALNQLLREGMIRWYPPLVEVKDGGLVSQAEHSVVVMDKPIITTKLDE